VKKRLALLGVSVALGSTMILTSAYAGMANTEGYDALKQAIKKTHNTNSVTTVFGITVRDNETVIANLNGTSKSSQELSSFSSTVHLSSGGEQSVVKLFRNKEQLVVKTDASEVYTLIEKSPKNERFHHNRPHEVSPELANDLETIVDAMVGNVKNYVTVTEASGQQTIELDLQGQQIPTVIRAAGSMVIRAAALHPQEEEKTGKWEELRQLPVHEELNKLAPKLTKDISIERIQMLALVDENGLFTEKASSITVSGQDESGQSHKVVVQMEAAYSDYNQTVPEVVQLEGKPLQTIELGRHE
jgi:hypothetical protein